MEESINVAMDDHQSTQAQIDLPVVFSDHELETSSLKEIGDTNGGQEELTSQLSSEDEVEEVQPHPKEKRLTKGLSQSDILGDPNTEVKTNIKYFKPLLLHIQDKAQKSE